jgi:hypothetical protein
MDAKTQEISRGLTQRLRAVVAGCAPSSTSSSHLRRAFSRGLGRSLGHIVARYAAII